MTVVLEHGLFREIAWALVLKVVALAILYLAFFAPPHRPIVTPDRAAARILAATVDQSASSQRKD